MAAAVPCLVQVTAYHTQAEVMTAWVMCPTSGCGQGQDRASSGTRQDYAGTGCCLPKCPLGFLPDSLCLPQAGSGRGQ